MSFDPEKELKDYPCNFNLATNKKVSRDRLLLVKTNVEQDLLLDDENEEEKVRNKNLLTWVLFNLKDKDFSDKALEMNSEVLKLRERKNISALGNLIFMCCLNGDKIQAKKYFKELHDLIDLENFHKLKVESFAEQAYSHSRLGGVENYKQCEKLYKYCTEQIQDRYLWKYGLGLVYRRRTNYNYHCSSGQVTDLEKVTSECAELMFDVAENGNRNLKGLAYAQLVCLKQNNRDKEIEFKNLDIYDLLISAVTYGGTNPAVLTMCGKGIKKNNIDLAIFLLKKSIDKRDNAIAYHHLGLSYVKKAEWISLGKYRVSVNKDHYDLVVKLINGEVAISCQQENITSGAFLSIEVSESSQDNTIQNSSAFADFESLESSAQFQLQTNEKSAASEYISQSESEYISQSERQDFDKISLNFGTVSGNQNNKVSQNSQLQHSFSKGSSSHGLNILKKYTKSSTIKLDLDNKLVKEAIYCFNKSLKVSQNINITARLSLADVYLRANQFQEALSHYNLIIDTAQTGYILCLITAHENAGKCLVKLSEIDDQIDKESLLQDSKQQFIKALSLAADLASIMPEFKTCETEVWESFRLLLKDVDRIESQQQRQKQHIKLLELAKNEDIARVIKEMLEKGLELDDIDIFLTGLNSYLNKADYEEALAFLNMASTKSALTENESWSCGEVMDARSSTYICTAWARLHKGSADSRRVFQQMFQLTYGQCSGIRSSAESDYEMEIESHRVLVVNDETADSEDGPDHSTILACNLCQVFEVMFGLETSRNLESGSFDCPMKEEAQLQEMEKYHLIVLILGENDDRAYNQMLHAVHNSNGPKFVVISIGESKNFPEIVKMYKSINIKDSIWQQTKLLADASDGGKFEFYQSRIQKMTRSSILEKLYDGNSEAVMRLFCFLVDQDFEKHEKMFF